MPILPAFDRNTAHPSFLKGVENGELPESVESAVAELERRLRVTAIDAHTEGRKYAILRYLLAQKSPAAIAALDRFSFVKPRIVRRTSVKPKQNPAKVKVTHLSKRRRRRDPNRISNRSPAEKTPLYEDFGHRAWSPEISSGAVGLGRNRRH
ncbi:hypothetical protein [Gordonia caeni]|uniref:Uncharacterized protein n=1 Tax=Gordonia caeni TaxID=1007097 RepID=A0ABP7PIE1_9ACTN